MLRFISTFPKMHASFLWVMQVRLPLFFRGLKAQSHITQALAQTIAVLYVYSHSNTQTNYNCPRYEVFE